MTERVVLALRELADALEELQEESPAVWTGQGVTPQPRVSGRASASPSPGQPAFRSSPPVSKEPCSSSVQYHKDLRLYLVLTCPRKPELVGLFRGEWKTLEAVLPGGRLSGSSARLRRVPDVETARQIWSSLFPDRALPELQL